MTAKAPIAARVGQLVRLLASPSDGETLAAARAIGRTLRAHRLDIHDLADAIEHAPLPAAVQTRQEAPPAPALRPWQVLAVDCLRAGSGRLKPTEMDFLRSMTRWPASPSPKQARWIAAIAAALNVEVAP